MSSAKAAAEQNVAALKYQLNIERIPASKSIKELVQYIQDNEPTDPFLHPVDKKENPWADRGKCSIL
ncbi:guanine nucleotide-binding protein subunit gamma-e-like [Saccoglossus kowalevskii]|uniref:Guanine nucleotide-binding protein subunit gamma n=1 Tax=Saccoglossus kowalevskii TaxID=10224 RepID=A0ABM0GRF0_SACKO|nr:PREDICTED: guanine nucleotide-binding protein subunit gamma-e-like [Saccoglossus kowalevskii]